MPINDVFNALADQNRRSILKILKQKSLAVGDIAVNFDLTLPSLSHHLSVLKHANLVSAKRRGQQIIYSLNRADLKSLGREVQKYF